MLKISQVDRTMDYAHKMGEMIGMLTDLQMELQNLKENMTADPREAQSQCDRLTHRIGQFVQQLRSF